MASSSDTPRAPRLRRYLAWASLGALGIWLLFFDSHAIVKRVAWHHEVTTLTEENARLRAEIEALEAQLSADISDAMVERIAREQYGMHRPGETVYRVEPAR